MKGCIEVAADAGVFPILRRDVELVWKGFGKCELCEGVESMLNRFRDLCISRGAVCSLFIFQVPDEVCCVCAVVDLVPALVIVIVEAGCVGVIGLHADPLDHVFVG